ncbi:hypothetical protein [Emticicia sp. 21SJ11W-3]|uniref:hypothetical protein n=1 Tax=Emticicia sp. 21SJ11W-3 TaxID=2916755 RepID=UPI00209D9D43|nr:hypothetical protein [Emticicia sp. 21SJ11W-3]UTA70070.1 hypothetical protein MB380_09670 [Emticicia sp. 21SJ11W-3]
MKKLFISIAILFTASSLLAQTKAPEIQKGNFMDDYKITYTINDTLWTQKPNAKYHIIKWNEKEQYLIARNDVGNPADGGLYTRIDYMAFENMSPFLWGFCLSAYNAPTAKAAEAVKIADRANPRKGCNGFPFSRMKRVE